VYGVGPANTKRGNFPTASPLPIITFDLPTPSGRGCLYVSQQLFGTERLGDALGDIQPLLVDIVYRKISGSQ